MWVRRYAAAMLAGAVLALSFDGAALAQNAPPAPKVTVAKPVVKPIMEWDDFTGRFEAVDSVNVRARVSGYLDKVHFEEGSLVQEGDLLFTIDPRPYQAIVDEAVASLTVAKTEYDFASKELARAETLVERGNISRSALDERRQRFAAAQAQIEGAKAALRRAELDMEFTKVRAPFAGRVSVKQVSIGNLIKADETVLTNIVSQDPIHFYFDVDERSYLAYARMAREGERASGRVTPYNVRVTVADERLPEFLGHLDFVDNRIDEATGTMRGRAVFPNADLILQPGLFGRISIPGSPVYQGVLIPDEAIGSDQDRRIVYVVDDANVVSAQVIRPGPRIDGYRVVRTGLTGSERIVVKGLIRVRPGMTVDPESIELPEVRS
jgi:multidrug efflux system membrane fusion protein